jgi:hypothetical protein
MVLAAFDRVGWDEPDCNQVYYRRVANGLLAVLQIGPDGTPRSPENAGHARGVHQSTRSNDGRPRRYLLG